MTVERDETTAGSGSIPVDSVIVNGTAHSVTEAQGALADFLRDDIGLTGTKLSCGAGFCGACTVLVNGRAASACSIPVADLAGEQVTTIEGLAGEDGRLHPVQRAFAAESGFQCGYCTPGMIMTAVALLSETPDPTTAEIHEYFEGNICRCTGYASIVAAVRTAAPAFEAWRRTSGRDGEALT